jgi:CRP-like cAMP-binding protein
MNMDTALFEKGFPSLARHLGPENVALLLQLAESHEFPAGHPLINDMSPVDAVHLIVSGELSVELKANEESLLLGRIGKGKWVGEVSLFTEDRIASAAVTTDVPTKVLSLKHADFRAAQSQHPDFVSALTQVFLDLMTQRLRASDQTLQQIGEHRLAFQGSDTLLRSDDDKVRQGWLKTMLKKLSGVEG